MDSISTPTVRRNAADGWAAGKLLTRNRKREENRLGFYGVLRGLGMQCPKQLFARNAPIGFSNDVREWEKSHQFEILLRAIWGIWEIERALCLIFKLWRPPLDNQTVEAIGHLYSNGSKPFRSLGKGWGFSDSRLVFFWFGLPATHLFTHKR